MDYVQDILFIIILCQPSKKEEYNQYLQAFVFGALLNSTLILLGESLGIEVSHWGDVDTKRLTILGRDPNEMGMVHCFAIAISLYLMRVGKNKLMKIINLIIAVLSAASILFTGSRTATIAVVVLIVINFILAKRKFGGFVVGLIVTILLAFSVYYFSTHFLDESILERYTSIGEELEEGTMASRTLIWAKCIDAFVNSDVVGMVFGHGYNTTPLYTFDNYDAHNVF